MISSRRYFLLAYIPATLFFLSLVCAACSYRSDVFHEFNDIPARGWDKRNIQKFFPYIDSTNVCYDIFVELNYNNSYGYRNLYLFITAENTDRKVIARDTLNCMMADEFGKWTGNGWGSSFQQTFLYKRRIMFDAPGTYTISVSQGMREDIIRGVERIGLRISPSKD